MAEARFTLANAVRVAGPDRILFCRVCGAGALAREESPKLISDYHVLIFA